VTVENRSNLGVLGYLSDDMRVVGELWNGWQIVYIAMLLRGANILRHDALWLSSYPLSVSLFRTRLVISLAR
jgi:hypothetical protein